MQTTGQNKQETLKNTQVNMGQFFWVIMVPDIPLSFLGCTFILVTMSTVGYVLTAIHRLDPYACHACWTLLANSSLGSVTAPFHVPRYQPNLPPFVGGMKRTNEHNNYNIIYDLCMYVCNVM